MPVGEKPRSNGPRGISQFLAEHGKCDAGFDVGRSPDAASGRLSVTCKGCGASAEYDAGQAAELIGATDEPLPGGVGRRFAPSDEATAAPRRPRRRRRRAGSRGRGRGALATALLAALVAAGVAFLIVALTDSDPAPDAGPAAPPPAADADAANRPTEPAPASGGGSGDTVAAGGAKASRAPIVLSPRSVSGPFQILVPRSWQGTEAGGVATFVSPARGAFVQVFYESGEQSLVELSDGARRYLADKHPGAEVSAPKPTRVGGIDARRITARYPGGLERAFVLVASGYSYLVTSRVAGRASERIAQGALAAARSMRPAA